MTPYTSLYHWPDGKTYTCFVFIEANKAKCYLVTREEAIATYPDEREREAVKRIAIDRFQKGEA